MRKNYYYEQDNDDENYDSSINDDTFGEDTDFENEYDVDYGGDD